MTRGGDFVVALDLFGWFSLEGAFFHLQKFMGVASSIVFVYATSCTLFNAMHQKDHTHFLGAGLTLVSLFNHYEEKMEKKIKDSGQVRSCKNLCVINSGLRVEYERVIVRIY